MPDDTRSRTTDPDIAPAGFEPALTAPKAGRRSPGAGNEPQGAGSGSPRDDGGSGADDGPDAVESTRESPRSALSPEQLSALERAPSAGARYFYESDREDLAYLLLLLIRATRRAADEELEAALDRISSSVGGVVLSGSPGPLFDAGWATCHRVIMGVVAAERARLLNPPGAPASDSDEVTP